MKLYGHPLGALLRRTWKEIGEDKLSVYAAQMAYTFFFALFPLLLFATALLGLLIDRATVMQMLNGRLAAALPKGVWDLVAATLLKVTTASGKGGILSFGFITAIWSGSSLFGSFRDALNDAYDVCETRPLWKQWALQIGMLIAAGCVLLLATVVLLNGNNILGWVGGKLHLSSVTTLVWTVVQYPLAIGAVLAVLWAQYYFMPNVKHQNKTAVLTGTVIAAALWALATLLFRFYVQKFNALNPAYGAIGAIMVLLTWMYYSSYVLLAAGELNSELGAHDAGVGRDGKAAPPKGPHAATVSAANDDRRLPVVVGGSGDARAARVRLQTIGAAGDDARGDGHGTRNGRLSLGGLLTRLVHGAAKLAQLELQLAREELRGVARGLAMGSASCAAGVMLATVGGLTLLCGIVLLAGDQWLPADLYWLAALAVAVVAGAIAMWARGRSATLLAPRALEPRETVDSIEETTQWAAHELTSTTKSH